MAKRILILVIVGVAVFTACRSNMAEGSALENTSWRLVDLNGESPLGGSNLTLNFIGKEVSGSAGCNTFGGSYEADSMQVKFTDLYNTEMACMEPDGVMDQEQEFLEILREVSSYQVAGDQLALQCNSGRTLVFEESN